MTVPLGALAVEVGLRRLTVLLDGFVNVFVGSVDTQNAGSITAARSFPATTLCAG